jgi:hypothetical protein
MVRAAGGRRQQNTVQQQEGCLRFVWLARPQLQNVLMSRRQKVLPTIFGTSQHGAVCCVICRHAQQ